MEYPREIANTIKQFEESFEQVDEFLKNYHQSLGPAAGGAAAAKPQSTTAAAPPTSTMSTAGGNRPDVDRPRSSKSNGNSSRAETVIDSSIKKDADLEHRTGNSNINNVEELSSLDQAKKQLVDAYAINSIFWMYLCVQGGDPRSHTKHELERIRKYMNLIKEVTDKQKAPKLNVKASKRLIRGAMFDTDESNKKLKKDNSNS